jgi:hypothetical protein
MRVHTNIKVSEEARELLLKNYSAPDNEDPSAIEFLPCFSYIVDCRDKLGNPMRNLKLGYRIFRCANRDFRDHPIFAFDNNRKFFLVAFRDRFDENATYLLEYFDGTVFLLKEETPDADLRDISSYGRAR